MQMPVDPRSLEVDTHSDRRDMAQPSARQIGRLVAVSGSRATIATSATTLSGANSDFWSVGRLISISAVDSRIVGLVCEMGTTSDVWSDDVQNKIRVELELLGEIREKPEGGLSFKRGIGTYPHLGSVAHRIRAADLAAVYEVVGSTAVEIGRLTQDDSIPAVVSIDEMLKRHFAVMGTTGVGKSSAVSLLVRQAVSVKPNLRVLVLDPHNEYAHAFPDNSITLDASKLDLPFWMFRFDEFVDIVFRGQPLIATECEFLRDGIAMARSRFQAGQSNALQSTILRKPIEMSHLTADTPTPYRLADLLGLIDEAMGRLETRYNRSDLRSLKGRIESLANDPRYRFVFGRTAVEDNLDKIISQIFRVPHHGKPITVFELSGVPSEVVNAVVSVLSRIAFDMAVLGRGQYEILLLCEEAHRYVPQSTALGFAPTRQAIARIAKEGRKYGAYLGVVTQRPGELDPTILSQCSTVFAMRLANDKDQEIIRSALSDSSASTISFLSSIDNREAIAFGEAIATPMRMKFTWQPREKLPETAAGHRAATGDLNLRTLISQMRGQSSVDPDADEHGRW
jgi:uncharacterized protein